MFAHLVDVSIRSLVLAALVLCVPRARRSAAFRHALWTFVVCGMLSLFAFGSILPRLPLPLLNGGVETVHSQAVLSMDTAPAPLPAPMPVVIPGRTEWRPNLSEVALSVWAVGMLFLLVRLLTGMLLARKLALRSREIDGFFESDLVRVPFTIGWLRPTILLPVEWRGWSAEKLTAVLEHEGAHARRHDGLIQLLAGLNRCILWFHPVAWFAERRIALLAEQACDEACVAASGDPGGYARLLVEMASVMDGSHSRLRSHALTMAAAPHLRKRVDSLMAEGRTFSRGLTRTGWLAIAVCGIPLVLAAAVVEVKKQPPLLQMDLPHAGVPAPPVLLAQAQTPATPIITSPAPERFDTATIKPCEAGDAAGRPGRGGAKGRGFGADLGVFYVHCMSVSEMLDFVVQQRGLPALPNDETIPMAAGRIRGGPSWATTDYYTIEARTTNSEANAAGPVAGTPGRAGFLRMSGPMLLSLLEDRFHLRFHTATEQVPMYAMSVASGGLKLKPFEAGNCVDIEKGIFPYPGGFRFGRDPKPPCHWIGWDVNGPNFTLEGGSVQLSRVSGALGELFLDRHVLDQTAITTEFNIHLEYLPDEHAPLRVRDPKMTVDPLSNIPKAPTIFTAIEQQLGLKLESTTGQKGYVMIDAADRPEQN